VISPDLTRENPGTPPNLDAETAALRPGPRPGVIYAIAPSRLADHDIWVGTDDGFIWRTRDEGAHWQNITPPALTPWSKVGIIDASHYDAESAYAAVDRHRLDDFRPYIYRTHDGGKTWQWIGSGLPTFVNAVREDPARRGLLYAATEKGVSVSFDDGDHWQSLQMNLPVTSVRDIEVHGNDVVIATHGRALWIMDDVTPLRQIGAYLIKPATAIRFRPAGFTGSPMPKDEPMASNPPFGAYIDYVCGPALAGRPAEAGPHTHRAAFFTLPLRMHRVQTLIRRTVLPIFTRTRCRFGSHRRLLTLWAWLIRFPNTGVFPQTSQILAIR